MKVSNEQIEKYIKKHPHASLAEIAASVGACEKTIREKTKAMGYAMRKVWVRV